MIYNYYSSGKASWPIAITHSTPNSSRMPSRPRRYSSAVPLEGSSLDRMRSRTCTQQLPRSRAVAASWMTVADMAAFSTQMSVLLRHLDEGRGYGGILHPDVGLAPVPHHDYGGGGSLDEGGAALAHFGDGFQRVLVLNYHESRTVAVLGRGGGLRDADDGIQQLPLHGLIGELPHRMAFFNNFKEIHILSSNLFLQVCGPCVHNCAGSR